MITTHQKPVLDRLLDPVGRCLNKKAAQQLIDLRVDAKVQSRVAELAEKCNEDLLTPAERAEYETYVSASSLIAVLQAKARLHLLKKGVS